MREDAEITNRRADATQNESLIGIARMGADAFGYRAELRVDRGLAQLLRLKVSQLDTAPTASTSITRPPVTPASRHRRSTR